MFREHNILKRIAAAACALLVFAWILAPVLHESGHDEHHDHGSAHSEQDCAMCALAGHGVVHAPSAPAQLINPVATICSLELPPRLPCLTHRPDVRLHGSQGPPSA